MPSAVQPPQEIIQHQESTTYSRISIMLPDLFQSFLKDAPPLNPHYETIREESEQWLDRFCEFPADMSKRIHKCDFSYFCAIVAPYAPPDRFRILCDWGNWVFPYDDMFDVEGLCYDIESSQRVMESLLDPLFGRIANTGKKLRIVQAHDDLASRLYREALPGVKQRFAWSMQQYARGVMAHVNGSLSFQGPTLEEKIKTRRESAGASPLYHLAEYCHDLKIPDEVFDSPVIRKLETLGQDMVFMFVSTNDILSYRKEEPAGVPDNIIATCRINGLTAQEAFNTAGALLENAYRNWEETEARIPSWGKATDIEVRSYVDVIKSVVKANLYWSFRTDRYLGRDAKLVRRDRRIDVMESPPYLRT